ncbi:histone acetyltransferase-like protein [Perkinsela sp. CCAP 1560/4]|nr:histone acetyltransferase-like protein [Perkinsela sp. CCAP 1560/4]|eukprot:KNH03923.1 histone acetyltransferase-like protein [Perkinsela sp. CCAP 1560/4]
MNQDSTLTLRKRRDGDYTDHMKKEHFEWLGEYDDPEEAEAIKNTSCTILYDAWEDMTQEEQELIRSCMLELHKYFQKKKSKEADNFSIGPNEYLQVSQRIFRRLRKVTHGSGFPRKSALVSAYRELVEKQAICSIDFDLMEFLQKKKTKSHSGVLVVSVIMGPGKFSCPKDCHYCPNQPGVARSYLLREPGVLRGFRNDWDPIRQFNDRARSLENNGHVVDKIEIIILGGTFSFYPKEYAAEFMAGLYYAANTYYDPNNREMFDLQKEITTNETSECRIIGLTIETRPDYITWAEIVRLRSYGVTRVQLGIQHTDNEVLDYVNRDCPIEKSKRGIRKLLEAGFKVDAHWMPDLPGSSYEKDLEMFKYLLGPNNDELQVDQWKVYPTATVPFTKIKEWYEAGQYKPYAKIEGGRYMVDLICYILENIPYRIRINRIIRDIPSDYIIAGEDRPNLRQTLEKIATERGIVCKDIRERECKGKTLEEGKSQLYIDEFVASQGKEFYISIEDEGRHTLYGHLRLRINENIHDSYISELRHCALIRELHTYGKLVAVNRTNTGKETQHIGVGKRLMAKAEELAVQHGCPSTAVIAGVGVRNYYRKLGYALRGTYMVKNLDSAHQASQSKFGGYLRHTFSALFNKFTS